MAVRLLDSGRREVAPTGSGSALECWKAAEALGFEKTTQAVGALAHRLAGLPPAEVEAVRPAPGEGQQLVHQTAVVGPQS